MTKQQARKQELIEKVRKLMKEGLGPTIIAIRVGVNRNYVTKLVRMIRAEEAK